MKLNINNLKVKRSYYTWLKEADGKSEASINKIECALNKYEEFSKYEDFSKFSSDKAIKYKKWLRNSKNKGKTIQLCTYNNYLRSLKKFLSWLSLQPGYKSKIIATEISYLNISDSDDRIAGQTEGKRYPDLEYVLSLTASIPSNNEVDIRDRALISFAALTGARDTALATLPIGCVDLNKLVVYQDPKRGVKTKFSKLIISKIFNFDEKLMEYVKDWMSCLKNKKFGSKDPLFPMSKMYKAKDDCCFGKAVEVEQKFWNGAGRIREIFKRRASDANLEYYNPHTFRDFAMDLAIRRCKNGEEIKAVSQNFGHENIATSIGSYANYGQTRLLNVLNKIDQRKGENTNDGGLLEDLKELISKRSKK